MSKTFAVVLSGAGAADGSEIHEATLALYAIASNQGQYRIFAPDEDQREVVNMFSGKPLEEKRSMIVEAARIARGKITPLRELNVNDFDVLLFPGGLGAAKNLCSWFYDGVKMSVREDVKKVILDFAAAGKPIGAMCIAPIILAKVLGKDHVMVTLGPDSPMKKEIENAFGCRICPVGPTEALVDSAHRVVTTPAYMYGDSGILQVGLGADALVKELIRL